MSLLLRLMSASLRSQAQYPGSALLLTAGNFLVTVVEAFGIWMLFDRFGNVQGWGIGEVAVFYGLVNISFTIADTLSRGFEVLGTSFLRTGEFDRLLLRPRTLTLQLMGYDLRISRAGRLLQAIIVLVVGSQMGGVEWSAVGVAMAIWAVIGGVALFFGVLVLQGTMSFWTIESLEIANSLTYGGVQAAQYPLSLYNDWFRGLLTFVVPLACVAYFPVLTILGRPDPLGTPAWLGPVAPLAAFVFLALSFAAWRIGVRRYTSTGS